MKILIVCQYYYPENFVISKIAETLSKKGHDVSVLTGLPNYGLGQIIPEYKNTKFEIINGVKVYRVKLVARSKSRFSIIRNYLSFWRNSKRWIKKNLDKDFDIVYSMSLSPVTILSPANLYKKKKKVPHVAHCVDLWPESVLITHAVRKKSLTYKILYKWSKALYSKADHICVGSPSFEKYFRDVLKIENTPIAFVPQPSLIEDNAEISTHDFGEGFHIVYCGNIGQIQMVEKLPEVISKLDDKNVFLHIIGMGPKSDELQANIKKYHVEDNVKFYGPMYAPTAAPYLKGASILYVGLKSDGYVGKTIPNKLMFYMTFSKPIIACLKGDGKSELEEAGGGIFVDEDTDSIVKGIKYAMTLNKKELKNMGNKNQSHYLKNRSIAAICDELITIFNRVKKGN